MLFHHYHDRRQMFGPLTRNTGYTVVIKSLCGMQWLVTSYLCLFTNKMFSKLSGQFFGPKHFLLCLDIPKALNILHNDWAGKLPAPTSTGKFHVDHPCCLHSAKRSFLSCLTSLLLWYCQFNSDCLLSYFLGPQSNVWPQCCGQESINYLFKLFSFKLILYRWKFISFYNIQFIIKLNDD